MLWYMCECQWELWGFFNGQLKWKDRYRLFSSLCFYFICLSCCVLSVYLISHTWTKYSLYKIRHFLGPLKFSKFCFLIIWILSSIFTSFLIFFFFNLSIDLGLRCLNDEYLSFYCWEICYWFIVCCKRLWRCYDKLRQISQLLRISYFQSLSWCCTAMKHFVILRVIVKHAFGYGPVELPFFSHDF